MLVYYDEKITNDSDSEYSNEKDVDDADENEDDEVVVVHVNVKDDVAVVGVWYWSRKNSSMVHRLNLDDELMSTEHPHRDHRYHHLIEEMYPYQLNVKANDEEDGIVDDDDCKASMFHSMLDEDNHRMELMKTTMTVYGSNRMKMKL